MDLETAKAQLSAANGYNVFKALSFDGFSVYSKESGRCVATFRKEESEEERKERVEYLLSETRYK